MFRHLFVIILLASSLTAIAQSEENIADEHIWLDFVLTNALSKKTTIYSDFRYRVSYDDPENWRQLMVRPSAIWKLNDIVDFRGGVGAFYSMYDDTDNVLEIRPWFGSLIRWPYIKRTAITYLVRFEERIVYEKGDNEWSSSERLRFRLGSKIRLHKSRITDHFYLPVFAEAFWDNRTEERRVEKQYYRVTLGAGYVLNKSWTFEFQTIFQRSALFGSNEGNSDVIFRLMVRSFLYPLEVDIDQAE